MFLSARAIIKSGVIEPKQVAVILEAARILTKNGRTLTPDDERLLKTSRAIDVRLGEPRPPREPTPFDAEIASCRARLEAAELAWRHARQALAEAVYDVACLTGQTALNLRGGRSIIPTGFPPGHERVPPPDPRQVHQLELVASSAAEAVERARADVQTVRGELSSIEVAADRWRATLRREP